MTLRHCCVETLSSMLHPLHLHPTRWPAAPNAQPTRSCSHQPTLHQYARSLSLPPSHSLSPTLSLRPPPLTPHHAHTHTPDLSLSLSLSRSLARSLAITLKASPKLSGHYQYQYQGLLGFEHESGGEQMRKMCAKERAALFLLTTWHFSGLMSMSDRTTVSCVEKPKVFDVIYQNTPFSRRGIGCAADK